MAGQLLLVNPRKRRKSPTKSRRRRASPRRRRNPIAAAPVRRRARRASPRRSNPARRAVRRYRRNPVGGRMGGLTGMLQEGAMQGIGATGVDVLMGYAAPLMPAALTGNFYGYQATKAALAAAVGIFGKPLLRGFAKQAAVGSLTCITRDVARSMLAGVVPLGAVGYQSSGPIVGRRAPQVGAYLKPAGQMGAYLKPAGANMAGLGQSARVRESVLR